MRPQSETSDFKLLVPSKSISYFRKYGTDEKVRAIDSKIVQLHKSGKMRDDELSRKAELSQPSDGILKILQTNAYTNMLGKYGTWSQVSIELLKAKQR